MKIELIPAGRVKFDLADEPHVRFDFTVRDAAAMESPAGLFVPVEARVLFRGSGELRMVWVSGPLVDQSGKSGHVDAVWSELRYAPDDYLGLRWLPGWAADLVTMDGAAAVGE